MNTKSAFPLYGGLLGLLALAILALEPLLALGYNQIVFTVVPALQAVNTFAFGH